MLTIREAEPADADAVWQMLEPVIREGKTYALDKDLTKADALAFWMAEDKKTFVATENDLGLIGTYFMKPNQSGGGAHVCNCGYVTAETARGKGIARQMCEHSMRVAPQFGYRAMQFNCVVSTNTGAVRLWERLGFQIIGALPEAFNHPEHGFVDAYIMYQQLGNNLTLRKTHPSVPAS